MRTLLIAVLFLVTLGTGTATTRAQIVNPCISSVTCLGAQYASSPEVQAAFQTVYEGLQPLPSGYAYGASGANPWQNSANNGAELAVAVDSLNILLFSPIEGQGGAQMVSPAVQTRMGNQIAILNTPYAAPKTHWTPD